MNMKTIIIKNTLKLNNLTQSLYRFFKELKENLYTNNILIVKITLYLKNGTECTLLENTECDLSDRNVIITLKRLIIYSYKKALNDNVDLNKDSDSIIFIYKKL